MLIRPSSSTNTNGSVNKSSDGIKKCKVKATVVKKVTATAKKSTSKKITVVKKSTSKKFKVKKATSEKATVVKKKTKSQNFSP